MNIGLYHNFYDRFWTLINIFFCSALIILHKYYRREVNFIVMCNIFSIFQNFSFLIVFSVVSQFLIMFTSIAFSLVNSIDIFFLKNIVEVSSHNTIIEEKINFEEVFEVNEHCIICLCEEGTFIAIKCKHKFHQPCIEEWIKHKRECPVCRIKL